MAKAKTMFFCQNCGAQSSRWMGKCSSCGEWNTFVEEVIQRESEDKLADKLANSQAGARPKRIKEIDYTGIERINVQNQELNRVLGGGLVPGSVVLIGGEPGIGKSTLMLQMALNLGDARILYVTGEESEQQIRMRADRIGIRNENCYILTETSTGNIYRHFEELIPSIVIIDSIQTLYSDKIDSSAGTVSQIRETASEMLRLSKISGVPFFLIGHITKDGNLAGPKVLEHMVDTVLQFEGDRNYDFRILRSIKNRFGSTSELGIFEMQNNGLREISNPSEILISHSDEQLSGVAIAASIEGMRPMLIETQALVGTSAYGTPQRSSTGFDLRRLSMLLAVLEKRCGFRLGNQDVFLNITGGISVDDPAIDLGIVAAVLSSSQDISIGKGICFAAEVGLSGEIRPVNRIEQRISEAERMGYKEIFISKYNKNPEKQELAIKIKSVRKIEEVYHQLFK